MSSTNKTVPESVKMKDVAERAEVSLMTISRALNTPDKVSPLTLKKIKKAIVELEYVPNMIAGTLSSQKSGFIAALVPFLKSSPLTDTIRALATHLREHHYQLLLGSTNYSIHQEEALVIMVSCYDHLEIEDLKIDTQRVLEKNYPNTRFSVKNMVSKEKDWWRFWDSLFN